MAAGGLLPPTIATLTATNSDFMAKLAESKGALKDLSDSGSTNLSKLSSVGGTVLAGLAGAAVAVGGVSLKMATDFQTATTQLVTGAGESEKNIGMVRDGILNMAAAVGQTPIELAQGMYLIESAGYHGAAGLTVLKASAEGAATGGAQMATVANAVTTALTDYHLPASQAADVTSALIQTVADGKTHLEDLATSLGKVMPVAAALGVTFPEVTAAIATMTDAGLSARQASTNLQNTLLALSAPSTTAAGALKSVGLTTQQVKDTLDGPGGLSAALQLIETHVGDTFPKNSVASVTALKDIMGGTTGYRTALMLSGDSAKAFEDDQKNIGTALDRNSQSVQGFGLASHDLSFQLKQIEAGAEATAIKIGDDLIPVVETLGHDAADVVGWLMQNKDVLYALGATAGAVAVTLSGIFVVDKVSGWVSKIESAGQSLINLGAKALGLEAPFATAQTDTEALTSTMQSATTTMQESMSQLTAALQADTDAIVAALERIGTQAEITAGQVSTSSAEMDTSLAGTGTAAEGASVATAEGGAGRAVTTGAEDVAAEGATFGAGASVAIAAALAAGALVIGHEIQKHFTGGGAGFGGGVTGAGEAPGQVTSAQVQSMTQQQYQAYQSLGGKVDHVGPFITAALQPALVTMQAEMAKDLTGIHTDQARDATAKQQATTFQSMLSNLVKLPPESEAAKAALAGLRSTADKWYPDFAQDKTIGQMKDTIKTTSADAITQQDKLIGLTDGLGKDTTLAETKSDLLASQQLLHKEETGHASLGAIQDTKAQILEETGHIKNIEDASSKFTKDQTAVANEKALENILATQHDDLKSKLDGVTIKTLPKITLVPLW